MMLLMVMIGKIKQIGKVINIRKWYWVECENNNVVCLDLSCNNLKWNIPKGIWNLINLEILYLNYNKITNIPKEILNLKNLKFLHLSDNEIKNVPKELIPFLNNLEYYEI